MPYFITDTSADCDGWAVVKDDGEVIGCHASREDAIDQMVAVSLAEGIEPGGELGLKAIPEDRRPPEGAREEARRGLEWRREYNRGGTAVGVARARDIANGTNLSMDTVRRMVSYFARHDIDRRAEGFRPGEEGYPSAGRIAWALWGGDPGRRWAESLVERADREEDGETRTGFRGGIMHQIHCKAAFDVDTADDAPHGEVTALVSVFNNVDLTGDRILPGAFAGSLERIAAAGRSIPFVWSHQWNDPHAYIGKVTEASETNAGLVVRAKLFDTPTAQHIKTLMAEGVVTEFSFAFDIIDSRRAKDGVVELLELNILEAGPTLKGANPATQLIGVRSATGIKAEPGELAEGDFVSWADGFGRVEYIMTEGTFGVEGDPLSLTASPDDPLAMVRVYDDEDGEIVATDTFRGYRFSELTLEEEPEVRTGELATTDTKSEEPAGANDERDVESETDRPIPDDLILQLELETLDL